MVIGKKSKPVGIMYIATEIFFLFFMGMGSMSGDIASTMILALFSILFLSVNSVILYLYFITPSDAIILNYDKSITLPGHNVTISMSEVTDISYRRASAKGVQYKWGSVTISAGGRDYKVRYLEKCEEVSKALTKEMYDYKYRNQ